MSVYNNSRKVVKIIEYKGFTGNKIKDKDGWYGYIQGTRVFYESEREQDLEQAFRARVDWLLKADLRWIDIFSIEYNQ